MPLETLEAYGLESCPPVYATPRRFDRPTTGGRIAKIAELLGQPLMPWQRYVVDVAGEQVQDEQGRWVPAYREAFDTEPRQSGKTLKNFATQVDRCVNWATQPQRCAFTAQSGTDAREKHIDELFPLLRASKLNKLVAKVTESAAQTALHFKTGSMIRILSTSQSSGHSKTLHQAVMDEIFHDVDNRREQALRPAMLTVHDAQLLVCSTAGTAASLVYNRKREQGRKAVRDGLDRGFAYFEWSKPDWADLDNPEHWGAWMPALGHTQTVETIAVEMMALPYEERLRAYGNVPTLAGTTLFGSHWTDAVSRRLQLGDVKAWGVAVNEDRSKAAIAACDADGRIELVEFADGTGWVAARIDALRTAHGGTVVRDGTGPASTLNLGPVTDLSAGDMKKACGAFYDALVGGDIRVRQDDELDHAANGVVKKATGGDGFVWSRTASAADVAPLEAATLARHGAQSDGSTVSPWVIRA